MNWSSPRRSSSLCDRQCHSEGGGVMFPLPMGAHVIGAAILGFLLGVTCAIGLAIFGLSWVVPVLLIIALLPEFYVSHWLGAYIFAALCWWLYPEPTEEVTLPSGRIVGGCGSPHSRETAMSATPITNAPDTSTTET